jgi:hypothetical protein
MRGLGIVRLRCNRSRFARVFDKTGRFSHAKTVQFWGSGQGSRSLSFAMSSAKEPTRRRRTSFVDGTAIAYDGSDR